VILEPATVLIEAAANIDVHDRGAEKSAGNVQVGVVKFVMVVILVRPSIFDSER
jgi:hypothetical protein